MRHTTRFMALIVLLITPGSIVALGQASSSTAELRGQVTDNTGAVIPGATITVTDAAKGAGRTATTDSQGNYVFIGLLPSTYSVKVEAKGFGSNTTKVELTVGQQASVPFKLTPGDLAAQVTVIAGAEVVETERTEQASTVDAKQINSLPINRRNFLDYALLTPGVADADNIADASDFRVAQTPQSGLSFGGNNGRGNSVSVDGAETISATGAVQATISQEAVQEFQVVRSSYNAEFGSASGGVVNIVSKSGGNKYHGSAFGLFRDDAFDARNFFDYNPNGKSTFNRQQYGGSIGGPIKADKTFFFASAERLSQRKTSFVNLLADPNLFGVSQASSDETVKFQSRLFDLVANSPDATASEKVDAARLRGALSTSSYANTVNLYRNSSGQFPFGERQTQFSTRVDHNFTDRSTGYLRFNLTDAFFENQAAGALSAVSRGRTFDAFGGALVASHNYQFSGTTFNELKLQFSHTRSAFIPNDMIGPEFNLGNYGSFNRDIFLPSRNIERHIDINDNITKASGRHTYKFGGSMSFQQLSADNQTFIGGRFIFGQAIPFGAVTTPPASPLNASATNVIAFIRRTVPAAQQAQYLAVFSTPMTALQAFNFGIPTIYQQGFGDPIAKEWTNRYGIYAQDTWKVYPNLTLNYGLRYAINNEPFFVPTSKRDLQPRAGFSWDPKGNGKTVIRGGAGIFTGFLNNAVANVTSELSGYDDPTVINIVLATALTAPTTAAVVYGSLSNRGILGSRPITQADIASLGLTPGTTGPNRVRFRLGPNYRTPTTYQASLGIQREIGRAFSLEVSYLFSRGIYLSRNRDINQFRATGAPNALNPLGGPTFNLATDRRDPLLVQDNVYENTANSFYHGFTVQLQRRLTNYFSINTHYTFAKSIDEVTDYNSDFSAQNPLNLRADRSLSSFDQRHRFVASGSLISPFRSKAIKDWSVSPIFVAQSGRPFNLLMGGIDTNNDLRSSSDRPGLAGRNTGIGEDFYSFDLRMARRLFVKESRYVEVTFEAFNLFNRTNLQGINNQLGGACLTAQNNFAPCTLPGTTPLTSYDLRGSRDRRPTDPLGFISAGDSRQMQFGLRLMW